MGTCIEGKLSFCSFLKLHNHYFIIFTHSLHSTYFSYQNGSSPLALWCPTPRTPGNKQSMPLLRKKCCPPRRWAEMLCSRLRFMMATSLCARTLWEFTMCKWYDDVYIVFSMTQHINVVLWCWKKFGTSETEVFTTCEYVLCLNCSKVLPFYWVIHKRKSCNALLFAVLTEFTNNSKYHMSHNTQPISFEHTAYSSFPLRLFAFLSIFTTAIVSVTCLGAAVTLNGATDARQYCLGRGGPDDLQAFYFIVF